MPAGVLLVTGGSRGIGEAIAVLGARRGHDVVFSYANSQAHAAAVVARIRGEGGNAEAVRADTAREEDIENLFSVADRRGRLAAMVYNSGITGTHSPLAEAATSTIDAVLGVNLRGAILCCRSAIQRMSTRLGGQGGAIVLMSSVASFYGSPHEYVWYAASKGGMDSLVHGLGREVAEEGIRVNAVSPGPVATGMHRPGRLEVAEKRAPMQRAGTPEEVAEAVLFLASGAASYVTGANLSVSGGM